MPHDQCPPNRRGHTWSAQTGLLAAGASLEARRAQLEARVCKRCGARGRVNKLGIVELEPSP